MATVVLGVVAVALPWFHVSSTAASHVQGFGSSSFGARISVPGYFVLPAVLGALLAVPTLILLLLFLPLRNTVLLWVAAGLLAVSALLSVVPTFSFTYDASSNVSTQGARGQAEVEVSTGVGLWLSLVAGLLGAGAALQTARRLPGGARRRTSSDPVSAVAAGAEAPQRRESDDVPVPAGDEAPPGLQADAPPLRKLPAWLHRPEQVARIVYGAAGAALLGTLLPWLTVSTRTSSHVSGFGGGTSNAGLSVVGLSLWQGLIGAGLAAAAIILLYRSRKHDKPHLRRTALGLYSGCAVLAVLAVFVLPSGDAHFGGSGRASIAHVSVESEWSTGIGLWITLLASVLAAVGTLVLERGPGVLLPYVEEGAAANRAERRQVAVVAGGWEAAPAAQAPAVQARTASSATRLEGTDPQIDAVSAVAAAPPTRVQDVRVSSVVWGAAAVAVFGTFLPWVTWSAEASSLLSSHGGSSFSASASVSGWQLWHGPALAVAALIGAALVFLAQRGGNGTLRWSALAVFAGCAGVATLCLVRVPGGMHQFGAAEFTIESAGVRAASAWHAGVGLWVSLGGAVVSGLGTLVLLRAPDGLTRHGADRRRASSRSSRYHARGRSAAPALSIALVVLLLVGGGAAAFFLLQDKEPTAEERAHAARVAADENRQRTMETASLERAERERAEARRRAVAEEAARSSLAAARGAERTARKRAGDLDLSPAIEAFEQVVSTHAGTPAAIEATARSAELRGERRRFQEERDAEHRAAELAAQRKREEQAKRREEEERVRVEAAAAQQAAEVERRRRESLASELERSLAAGDPRARIVWRQLRELEAEHPLLVRTRPQLASLPIPPGSLIAIENLERLGFADQITLPHDRGVRIQVGAHSHLNATVDLELLVARATDPVGRAVTTSLDRILEIDWTRSSPSLVRTSEIRKELGSKGPPLTAYGGVVRCLPGDHVAIGRDLYRVQSRKHMGPYRHGSSQWGDLFFGFGSGMNASDYRTRRIPSRGSHEYVVYCCSRSSSSARLGCAKLRKTNLSGTFLGTLDVLGQGPAVVPFEVVPHGSKRVLLTVTPERIPVLIEFRGDEMREIAHGPVVPGGLTIGSPTAVDLDGDGAMEYVAPVQRRGGGEIGLWVLLVEERD